MNLRNTAQKTAIGERRESYLSPEGVPISFVVAPMGARIGAQLIDIMLTYLSVILFSVLLITSGLLAAEAQFTLVVLLVFLIRVPYYILSELVWNGRTMGKRLISIRVINTAGRRLTPHQIVARNLMKEVEIFTPGTMLFVLAALSPVEIAFTLIWIIAVLIVPFANRRRQRLGDMVAGTIVVYNPRNALLPDLAASAPAAAHTQEGFDFLPEHLSIYGRFELQTLENVLREPLMNQHRQLEVQKIAHTIIDKIRYDSPVSHGQELQFLNAFYRAQREHLEMLRLFGTRREDKFHDKAPPTPPRGRNKKARRASKG